MGKPPQITMKEDDLTVAGNNHLLLGSLLLWANPQTDHAASSSIWEDETASNWPTPSRNSFAPNRPSHIFDWLGPSQDGCCMHRASSNLAQALLCEMSSAVLKGHHARGSPTNSQETIHETTWGAQPEMPFHRSCAEAAILIAVAEREGGHRGAETRACHSHHALLWLRPDVAWARLSIGDFSILMGLLWMLLFRK